MQIKVFEKLPKDALDLRIQIFVNEQGFSDGENDDDAHSVHFVAYEGTDAVATARLLKKESGECILGRIAVVKHLRGQGIGKKIVTFAEDYARVNGIPFILIHAQYHAKDFYEKIGYFKFGDVDYEQGRAHQWFKKELF